MNKKLFVLFVLLILTISLSFLFLYDKKALENEKKNEIMENYELIIDDNKEDEVDGESDDESLGSLKIEKIGLNAPIKEGSSTEVLKLYIGHIEETAKYDGNVGLAAHNRGNEYSYFSRVNELEPGDEIIYNSKFGERRYIVDSKKEILETDWSMLNQTKDNRLTLITCIKNKVNQRLCVQAVQKGL